ncbi:hypothetical protein [Hymenobacter terrenus]|uniref:hypothetical protein n=1 Tax=Hymenobacter terrenus TaxID=1629124 RepID=UPI000619F851|nr:hypothetical protein [Hymenobacter terrenus]
MIFFITSPRLWRWVGLLVALLGLLPTAWAQRKVQVVTRTLEQSWNCPPGMTVRIRAEKANVQVRAWDRPTVQVTLRLSARHADRAVAEQDLPVAKYRLQKNGNALDLINFYTLAEDAPAVRSDLRAEYTVFMPAGNTLQVANAYGQTDLTDLTGEQTVDQSFGQIHLRNLSGTLGVTARYADLTGINLQADFTCEANRSAVQLLGLGGSSLIRNYYGSVHLQATAAVRKLRVETNRTEVVVSVPQPELFGYELSVQQGLLTVPPAFADARKGNSNHASLTVKTRPPRPVLHVSATYAPLTFQTQPLAQL